MQVVILLGGMATRLRPITRNIPKAMIIINGRPFLEHQIELLKKNGLKNFVFCVGYKWNLIKEYFGNGNRYNIEIKYSYDGKYLLGTAGAVRKAIKVLDEDFIILYGDTYLQIEYRSLIDYYYKNKSGYSGLMSVYKNDNKLDKSNVIYKNGKIIKYDKFHYSPEMKYIDYGISILKKEVLKALPANKRIDLADVYAELTKKGLMLGYEVFNRFYEIGTQKSLKEFENFIVHKQ